MNPWGSNKDHYSRLWKRPTILVGIVFFETIPGDYFLNGRLDFQGIANIRHLLRMVEPKYFAEEVIGRPNHHLTR